MENNTTPLYKNKVTIIAIVVVLLIIAGVFAFKNKSSTPYSPVVAKVGNLTITERDIAYRFNVEKAYGNNSATGDEILYVLTRDTKDQILAKSLDVFPMRVDIDDFKNHVDTTTKAPEVLNAVKKVFGEDIDSYERIYLLPSIINPSLHMYFNENKELNKEPYSRMEKALSEVSSGKSMSEVATKYNLQYSTSTQSIYPPGMPAEMKKALEKNKNIPPKSPLLQTLEQMKAGEVTKTVIDDVYTYSIVKLLSADKGEYKVETISTLKANYDDWYKQQTDKIKVEILKEAK